MGGISSKAAAFEAEKQEREEAHLGPPSKTMDASEYSQELIMLVSRTIESHLDMLPVPGKRRHFKAVQMITRELNNTGGVDANGTMYYIKVKSSTGECPKWPWLFVKIYEPPLVTGVSRVVFKGLKKMKDEYKLVTF